MKQLFFFLLIFASARSFAQKTKEESATEKFVLKLHENKFRWMVNRQLDSLNAILDERVQYVHSNGWTENKKEIIEDIKSGKLTMTSVKVSEATARVYKGFVIVNGKGIFNVVMNGTPIDISLLYTEVYAKRQNGWLLVSRHANRLP
ncbi:nuclear transport factor 2 family protein [Lacibacter sp. H375]|uniref:nuclear transport factor 2 family protein n=1 Tax=Lacibacter sp. H375 TaxID=3133424 RepID=UPI0030C21AED